MLLAVLVYTTALEIMLERLALPGPCSCSGACRSDKRLSDRMLSADSECRFPSRQSPAWHSPPMPSRMNAVLGPDPYPGPPPSPWSSPSPPRSWDHDTWSGGRHMGPEPYSPPLRFNMGHTPERRQSADHGFQRRLNRWSSPRGRVPSPRAFVPGPTGRMPSPREDVLRRRGRYGDRRYRSSSPRHRTFSPRDRSFSPRDHSLSPKDRSLSPRDRSLSPRDHPHQSRIRQQDTAYTSSHKDDRQQTGSAAANRPVAKFPSLQPDSPAHSNHLSSDLPAQAHPYGPDCCLCDSQPAKTSPASPHPVASHLAPALISDGALHQGPPSPVHGSHQPSQQAAGDPEQLGLQHHSLVARRKLDMSPADNPVQRTLPTDSSNTNACSTTDVSQIDLRDSIALTAVGTDISTVPLSHMQDTHAAATRCQRQTQGTKSLLEQVLRKSLALQDKTCKGLLGSDAEQASYSSSQDIVHLWSESASDTQTLPAKAADSGRPQQAEHDSHAHVRRPRRAKRPQPGDLTADPNKQTDAQIGLQADRPNHSSKRRRHSTGVHTHSYYL